MSIGILSVILRSKRRVRLLFTSPLDPVYVASTTPYAIISVDATATPPSVVAAYAVGGTPTGVELALDGDLVSGALYQISAVGVLAQDGSSSPVGTAAVFKPSQPQQAINQESAQNDGDLLLYGRDLVHNGSDYVEAPNGDLARVGGLANAEAAIFRRLTGSPLPWAPLYSPNAREFVDSVNSLALRGRLREQALRDDRVKACDAKYLPDQAMFSVTTTLIGGHSPTPFNVTIRK